MKPNQIIVKDGLPAHKLSHGDKSIAAISWKGLPGGMITIVEPDREDRLEFGGGTFRAAKGEMKEEIILKLDPKRMKVLFIDRKHYLDTEEVVWNDSAPLDRVVVYNSKRFNAAFGTDVLTDAILEAAGPALSFTEKRALQKIVSDRMAALKAGPLGFTAKRLLQKDLQTALSKLKGTAPAETPLATIQQVAEVMKETGMGSGWHSDPDKSRIADDGVKQGWLLRPSVTQVEWTENGIAALKDTEAPAATPKTAADANKVLPLLKNFIGTSQLSAMTGNMKGEEGQYFIDKLTGLYDFINAMPKTYDQDGMGDKAKVYLHYFNGGSDWYITEKDSDTDGEGQIQAYGYAVLNGNTDFAESGYISIQELIENGVELDLHWTVKTLGEVKGKGKPSGNETNSTSVGAAFDQRGWKRENEAVYTLTPDNDAANVKSSYMVSLTDQEGGGWALVSYLENGAWEPIGRSVDFKGNTPVEVVNAVDKIVAMGEEQKSNSNFTDNSLQEMVDAVVSYGGEVTGKKPPEVFFIFHGGVSAKLTAIYSEGAGAVAGFIGKNIDTGEETSLQQTADAAIAALKVSLNAADAGLTRLGDLLSGKYNNLEPEAFISVLVDIANETGDLEAVKPAALAYMEANGDKMVLESIVAGKGGSLPEVDPDVDPAEAAAVFESAIQTALESYVSGGGTRTRCFLDLIDKGRDAAVLERAATEYKAVVGSDLVI